MSDVKKQWEIMKRRDAEQMLFFAVYATAPTGQPMALRAYAAFGDDAAWLTRETPKLCEPHEDDGVAFPAGYLELILGLAVQLGRRAAVLEQVKIN